MGRQDDKQEHRHNRKMQKIQKSRGQFKKRTVFYNQSNKQEQQTPRFESIQEKNRR